jgi:Ca2+-binding EF-hand superfamily protein
MFLERLFYRIKHQKTESVTIDEFRDLIERSGFKFMENEFNNLIKWYFRGKDVITLEEFKLFATGNCVK